MDNLPFLDAEGSAIDPEATPAVAPEAPAEQPVAEAAEQAQGARERGPDGKFVAKAADAQPAAKEPSAAPESGHVPISAMLDERDKRQRIERELAELKSRAPAPQPPTESETLQAALYAGNLRASRKFAEREYGKDAIATVHDWAAQRCDADKAFNEQMRSSDDPYEAAYQAYSREQVLAEVKPSELDAFRAWKTAQAQVQAQQPSSHQQSDQPIPRSLATAPGNGAAGKPHIPVGPDEAYGSLFPS